MRQTVIEDHGRTVGPTALLATDLEPAVTLGDVQAQVAAQELAFKPGVRLNARSRQKARKASSAMAWNQGFDQIRGKGAAVDVGRQSIAVRETVEPKHLPSLAVQIALRPIDEFILNREILLMNAAPVSLEFGGECE